jgi:Rap1a immunity proteins
MSRIGLAAFILACWVLAPASARGVSTALPSGEYLFRACKGYVTTEERGERAPSWEEMASASTCVAFLFGANEMHDFYRVQRGDPVHPGAEGPVFALYCLPKGRTPGHLARVFTTYLTAHPERLHEVAIVLFVDAMKDAFPCRR